MEPPSLQFGQCLLEQQHILKEIVPYDNLPLAHPSFCQFDGSSKSTKRVPLSSVGIISDINSNLLITRRNAALPTFPSGWVFPGGMIDENEQFEEALIREVQEETGIVINKHKKEYRYENKPCKVEPVFQYESLYPKNAVAPWSQVLVLYFLVVLPFDYNSIMLNLQTDEVDAYTWVPLDDLYQILRQEGKREVNGYHFNQTTSQFVPSTFNYLNFCDIPEKINPKEFMPHGHRSAIKHIFENRKDLLRNSPTKASKSLR